MLNDETVYSTFSYYTTLKQLCSDLGLPTQELKTLLSAVPDFLDLMDLNEEGFKTNTQLIELFQNYIIPNYLNSVIDIQTYESDDDITDTEKRHQEVRGRISSWCHKTLKSYGVIAQYYTDNSTKLLDELSTVTTMTNRTSDTPEVSGSWDGDEQLSGIASATTETKTSPATVMSRLSEIRNRYRDVMQLWEDDFYKTFMTEVATW